MDKFRMVFQYFQSSSESVMNGICGLLALATVKMYTSFEFNCPCLPRYNVVYGLGVLLIPPVALFLCGLIVNRQSVTVIEEWKRPTGRRTKDLGVIRYMCSSILQRALVAPIVWILLTLLDGKCFICAFSSSVDPEKFAELADVAPGEVQFLLAKVPCKEDDLVRNSTSRKAVSRYLRCLSQALGWSITLLLILAAFLARSLQPCFHQAAFLQRRYWSNYLDLEQKLFDETCCEHARDFAHRCVLHFFDSMRKEIKVRGLSISRDPLGQEEGEGEGKEDHLHGITNQDQMNRLLATWYVSKPPLDIARATQAHPSEAEGSDRWPPSPLGRRLTKQTNV
ncbi:calcium homeostasis modulator protein 3 [Tachyglossus aculeatus]|uniref:calcium homeostasis modulator protein 3 n=1 Tax=Tachyglossus aculeatus TaxID=9261 RepID=UPI0018F6C054|nr:calcium homeostasis modulator protein 3 [Tachyglossus aculeatus]